jgi:hypothetical protein
MNKLLFLVIAVSVIGCASAPEEVKETPKLACHKTFSPEQLQEDFDILVTTLQEAHPDLYRVNPKPVIDKRIASVRAQLNDSLSYLEFLKLVAPLFTEIGCINTQWSHAPEFIRYRNDSIPLFPFLLEIREKRFFVGANKSGNTSIQPGTEITAINGETPGDYLVKNYALLPVDGMIRSGQDRWLERFFPNHHANFWEQPDTFNLSLLTREGKALNLEVPAKIKGNAISMTPPPVLPPFFYVKENIGVLTPRDREDITHEEFSLQLDSVCDWLAADSLRGLVINLRESGLSDIERWTILLRHLVDSSFTFIEKFKLDNDTALTFRSHVVLMPDTSTEILRKLSVSSQPARQRFTGNIYIITDGWCTGDRGFFCSKVKDRPRTFFAGEPWGACTFGMNSDPLVLKLPHTGITASCPGSGIQRHQPYGSGFPAREIPGG